MKHIEGIRGQSKAINCTHPPPLPFPAPEGGFHHRIPESLREGGLCRRVLGFGHWQGRDSCVALPCLALCPNTTVAINKQCWEPLAQTPGLSKSRLTFAQLSPLSFNGFLLLVGEPSPRRNVSWPVQKKCNEDSEDKVAAKHFIIFFVFFFWYLLSNPECNWYTGKKHVDTWKVYRIIKLADEVGKLEDVVRLTGWKFHESHFWKQSRLTSCL